MLLFLAKTKSFVLTKQLSAYAKNFSRSKKVPSSRQKVASYMLTMAQKTKLGAKSCHSKVMLLA